MQVLNEVQIQARMKYLAFKRLSWLFETVLLFIVVLFCVDYLTNTTLSSVLIGVQFLRVVTEAMNHVHLSWIFNIPDRWLLYPFG